VLDGVRAGVKIDMDLVRKALDKRAGRSQEEAGVSPRAAREQDAVEWLSGVMDGVSLGTPIAFVIRNKDARPGDYDWLKESYRVGHADEVYAKKYGIRDHRGGGRASARETAARVVAGSLAQQLLREKGIDVRAELVQVGTETDPDKFKEYILGIQQDGDSIGGIVECHITGLPAGIGEPIFDKLQSHLAFAMMSINACKGFEYGSGFGNIGLRGSEMYLSGDERLISGGIAGGISDGKEVVFRCVFKPTATNRKILEATHADAPAGRHDACIAVRAVAVVEAMAALVVADLMEEMEEMK
jgi:chorismate synthase